MCLKMCVEPFRKELSEIAAPSRTAEPSGESGHALEQMTYRFALDKDSDVRSFVMSFVDLETLEKQREQEESREEKNTSAEPMDTQKEELTDTVSMNSVEQSANVAEIQQVDEDEIMLDADPKN